MYIRMNFISSSLCKGRTEVNSYTPSAMQLLAFISTAMRYALCVFYSFVSFLKIGPKISMANSLNSSSRGSTLPKQRQK